MLIYFHFYFQKLSKLFMDIFLVKQDVISLFGWYVIPELLFKFAYSFDNEKSQIT